MKRALALLLLAGCNGTTGSNLVSFQAVAGGPADAASPMTFTTQPDKTAAPYQVTLTRAQLVVGAVYLSTLNPRSGAAPAGCIQAPEFSPYVAQVFGPVTVDLLSPSLTQFLARGEGIEFGALTAEVWLTSGDVNAARDPTVILDVAGSATRAGAVYPFTGSVTISENRAVPPRAGQPGSQPLCKQRIVTPIAVSLTPTDGGVLTLRVDPRPIFQSVDFAAAPGGVIPDDNSGAGAQLFQGLRSNTGVYQFTWSPGGP